jgi:hypothetical protein
VLYFTDRVIEIYLLLLKFHITAYHVLLVMVHTVSSVLLLKESLVLKPDSPNRENVRFSVINCKKEHFFSRLDWLLDSIRSKGTTSPNTLFFYNTMNDIASVTNYVMLNLG